MIGFEGEERIMRRRLAWYALLMLALFCATASAETLGFRRGAYIQWDGNGEAIYAPDGTLLYPVGQYEARRSKDGLIHIKQYPRPAGMGMDRRLQRWTHLRILGRQGRGSGRAGRRGCWPGLGLHLWLSQWLCPCAARWEKRCHRPGRQYRH